MIVVSIQPGVSLKKKGRRGGKRYFWDWNTERHSAPGEIRNLRRYSSPSPPKIIGTAARGPENHYLG